ncbi:hypothetical protein C8J56DRAFT_1164239 [Mycena floridula]|nr:hypothetical protein C8J56DRAFT_1164239 [Mycena floridula]
MELVDTIEPFPELPFELVCLIIEKLLEIEPKRAPALACLSRDIQPMIVEQALYRCVVLDRKMASEGFVDMIKSRCRPDAFYRDRVKVLWTTDYITTPDLHPVLSACSGVQQLTICNWMREDGLHPIIDALLSSGPRPSKLTCDYSLTSRPDGSHRFALPLFEKVTHLQLDLTPRFHIFNGRQLHSMKDLTHLALVADSTYPKIAPQKLHLADSIAVCIIYAQWFELNATKKIRNEYNDPRIVIPASEEPVYSRLGLSFLNEKGFIRYWQGGHWRDGVRMDMWKEAEAVVKAQKEQARSFAADTARLFTFLLLLDNSRRFCRR